MFAQYLQGSKCSTDTKLMSVHNSVILVWFSFCFGGTIPSQGTMPKHHTDPVSLTREAAWEAGVCVCKCVVTERVAAFRGSFHKSVRSWMFGPPGDDARAAETHALATTIIYLAIKFQRPASSTKIVTAAPRK